MRNILFRLETGFIGCSWEEEFEYEDGTEDREINEDLADWAMDKMRDMDYEWEEL